MSTIPNQQAGTRRRRRNHSDEFKANAAASWLQPGMSMAAVEPLHEAHRRFILSCAVLRADETPVALLDPGAGKTR